MKKFFNEIKNLYTGKLVYTKRRVSFTRLGFIRILEKYSIIKIESIKIEEYILYYTAIIHFHYKDYPCIIELDITDLFGTFDILNN